jgi:hypothetical protein
MKNKVIWHSTMEIDLSGSPIINMFGKTAPLFQKKSESERVLAIGFSWLQ